ncbi:MAG TPA: hypothetical protein VLL52_14620 [Anaerolineae bacterium]|nr:hypothetical protein [Anaerolineae bacterium]
MTRYRWQRWGVLVCGLLLGWGVLAAEGHGGGTPQLTNVVSGEYLLSVWTQPEPLRPEEEMHMTVALSRPLAENPDLSEHDVAGLPVLNAKIEATFSQGSERVVAEVTHANAANQLFYEGHLTLPREGVWDVHLTIAGMFGASETDFTVTLVSGPSVSWQLVVGSGGLLLLLLVVGWRRWSGGGDVGRERPRPRVRSE